MKLSYNRAFYKRALIIAVPIMIQNGITNFVNMLDNIMVGTVGTDQMSGVAVSNQLFFVWQLMLFGGLSGIGIFTSQLYGKGDDDGVRFTFRLQMYLSAILTVIGLIFFVTLNAPLIEMYLHADSGIGDTAATFYYAQKYLEIMLIGLIPFAFTQAYSNTLKATGETIAPMTASMAAVVINLIGNYIMIYGKFGAPEMGVLGAAVATVISRFIEFAYLAVWTHRNTKRFPFFANAFSSFHVPKDLSVSCLKKGTPLLINETLWAAGQATLAQNYAVRGLSVVAAYNISNTISNVCNVCFIAMGYAIGIIIGQELGKGNFDTVKSDALRLARFSVYICILTSTVMVALSWFFPQVYNTSHEIRNLAGDMIRITAIIMPIDAFANALYFTLRSGGKTMLTFIFDSCFSWLLLIPVTYCLVHFTSFGILIIYTVSLLLQIIKVLVGFVMVQRGIWIHNLTAYSE